MRTENYNGIHLYMNDIEYEPLLSRQEEFALGEKAVEGDPVAIDKLIVSNLRLVVKIANDFKGFGVSLGDLIAELRHLPDDLPPPEELDDPREHPMVRLMMEEGAWFLRIWPMVQMMVEARLASPGAPDSEEDTTGHSDFIP